MTSWQGGGGFTSRGGLSARPGNTGGPEQVQIQIGGQFDFDREVEGLRAHVGKIKEMTKLIDEERKQQGDIINTLEDTMERARMALRKATQRLNVAYKQAGSNHLLFLVLFVVLVLVGVYVWLKVYRLGKGLIGA
ncbi:Qc-snare protein, SFT1 family [Haematococcus lacustris]